MIDQDYSADNGANGRNAPAPDISSSLPASISNDAVV
jgi:hypothetical protein